MNPNIYYQLYTRGYYNLTGNQGLGNGSQISIDPTVELQDPTSGGGTGGTGTTEIPIDPSGGGSATGTTEIPIDLGGDSATTATPTMEVAETGETGTTQPSVNIEEFQPNFQIHIHDGLIEETIPVSVFDDPIFGGGGGGGGFVPPSFDEEGQPVKKKVNWFWLVAIGAGAYFMLKK
jgi:hypothetical protein